MVDREQLAAAFTLPTDASREARAAEARARRALGAGDLAAAEREIDRAWRTLPDDADEIAPLYAAIVAMSGNDPAAVLHLIARAEQRFPEAATAAFAVDALLACDDYVLGAIWRLDDALKSFCTVPGALLAQAAENVLRQGAVCCTGWLGLTPELDYIWQFAPGVDPLLLRVEDAAGAVVVPAPRQLGEAGQRQFLWTVPDALRGERLRFRIGGIEFIGSGRDACPDFNLQGSVSGVGRWITGSVSIGWSASQPQGLRVEDELGNSAELALEPLPWRRKQWEFHFDLRGRIRGDRLVVSARLPDGHWQALPDAPLLLEKAALTLPPEQRLRGRPPILAAVPAPAAVRASRRRAAPVDIIIPVYNAREESVSCLESVLNTVDGRAGVIVVDDGSEDEGLALVLDAAAEAGRIELVRNARNQGFGAAVNRALALHPQHDAVLLNSDTLVYGDWLERLRAAAYRGARVASVTAMSNEGSVASYPGEGGAIEPEAGEALHSLAARVNDGQCAELPSGVGHCLFLRRDALEAVGSFADPVFGRGYGEETDFCLRARALGWSHRLAGDVFVYHAGARSFGAQREVLSRRNQRLLNLRHTGFKFLLRDFEAKDPPALLRRRLDEARLQAPGARFALIVTLALAGGVDRFVRERMRELKLRGLVPLVLWPGDAARRDRVQLSTERPDLPNLSYSVPDELPLLQGLLASLPIERSELQHFIGLDERVIEMVRALGPYEVYLHDYAWYCPRVSLVDDTAKGYCGEPDLKHCESCLRRNGSYLGGEPLSVRKLRARSERWLREAAAVQAPSADCAQRYRLRFPGLGVRIEPLGPPLAHLHSAPGAAPGGALRVALIGAIAEHKGFNVLLACARDASRRRLGLEFVVVGRTEDDAALQRTGKVFVTGRYAEVEVQDLLRREQVEIVFMASVWPETWCYTLDHAAQSGLPIVAFDMGAIAERLRAVNRGTLLPPNMKPAQINDQLLRLAREGKPPGNERGRRRAGRDVTVAPTPVAGVKD